MQVVDAVIFVWLAPRRAGGGGGFWLRACFFYFYCVFTVFTVFSPIKTGVSTVFRLLCFTVFLVCFTVFGLCWSETYVLLPPTIGSFGGQVGGTSQQGAEDAKMRSPKAKRRVGGGFSIFDLRLAAGRRRNTPLLSLALSSIGWRRGQSPVRVEPGVRSLNRCLW